MGSGLVPENARINSFVVGAYTDAALCPSGIYHSITGIYCLIFGFLITLEIHYVSTNRIFAPARQWSSRFFRTFSRIRRNGHNDHYVPFILFDLIFDCFL